MKQKLKLALVGAGERGQYCYAPYAKMHGYEIEFVAVADPHKGRREKFVQDYHVPAEGVFETAEQFFARPRMADAVLICTQDSQHYAYACQAIDLGYSILLEKPISPSVRECLDLQRRAEEKGTQIMVCHVMRYTKFYRKLKELIDSGVIGDVVHVTHTENVAYWHYAHSYVRGNWHKTADSSPMILAKCCHDMDILSWLLGSRCRTVSSFGDLRYFREENAPAGSPARCTDGCPHSGSCPYYAPALYLDDNTPWPTALTALGPDQSYEARKKALEEGPYGKCVFHNDNDVVDHQVASLLFENGTTVAFTMCAFSDACDRTVKFMGTRGEIRASMDNNVIEVTGRTGIRKLALPSARRTGPFSRRCGANTTGFSSSFPATARRARAQRTRSSPLTAWDTARPSWRAEASSMPSGSRTETDRTISRRRFRQRKK